MDTENYTPTDEEFEKWDRQDNAVVIIATVVVAAVAFIAIPIIRLRREEKALDTERVKYNEMIHKFKYPNRKRESEIQPKNPDI